MGNLRVYYVSVIWRDFVTGELGSKGEFWKTTAGKKHAILRGHEIGRDLPDSKPYFVLAQEVPRQMLVEVVEDLEQIAKDDGRITMPSGVGVDAVIDAETVQ